MNKNHSNIIPQKESQQTTDGPRPNMDSTVVNVIFGEKGIHNAVKLLLDNGFYLPALTVLFSVMDAMANLNRPATEKTVSRIHFISWADRYVSIHCQVSSDIISVVGASRLTGLELYAARCAVLHTYGTESSLSLDGKARQIVWAANSNAKRPSSLTAKYKPSLDREVVIVDIYHFYELVFAGIKQFVFDKYSDNAERDLFEERLNKLIQTLPILPNML